MLLPPGAPAPERLGGLAAAVWEVLDDPLSSQEVAEAVRRLTGASDVDDAIEALVSRSLIVRTT